MRKVKGFGELRTKEGEMQERKMGAIELVLRCPENVNGISVDPQPDWTFDNLLSELDSIDKKLNLGLDLPTPFIKSQTRDMRALKDNNYCGRGFVMHACDDESYSDEADIKPNNSCGQGFVMHVSDDESDSDEADIIPLVSGARRFTSDDLYLSDDSDDDMTLVSQYHLMDRAGLAEVALTELTHELQLSVSEKVRSKISDLKTELVNENERFSSLTTKIQQNRKLQQERDRKFDLQYRRIVAEALDNHLTAVQRNHEHISQVEERRIRDDAALEEAKRKEKAIMEEKLWRERIKAEEEVKQKTKMTERTKAAEEAERKAVEETASKRASETLKTAKKIPKELLGCPLQMMLKKRVI